MKKLFLASVACAAVALTPIEVNARSAIRYQYDTNWSSYVEFMGPDGDFTAYPREDGPSCGGATWRNLLANLGRDTSGDVFILTTRCGENLKVCVDVEDKGRIFRPQVCATVGWSR